MRAMETTPAASLDTSKEPGNRSPDARRGIDSGHSVRSDAGELSGRFGI